MPDLNPPMNNPWIKLAAAAVAYPLAVPSPPITTGQFFMQKSQQKGGSGARFGGTGSPSTGNVAEKVASSRANQLTTRVQIPGGFDGLWKVETRGIILWVNKDAATARLP
jgi:hypothetical protein